jgi:hypothetical protein
MYRIIIALTALLVYTSYSAQESLDGQLLSLEKKYFLSENDGERAQICNTKLMLYVEYGVFSDAALNDIKRIDYSVLPDITKKSFLWNAALYCCLVGEKRQAMNYVSRYSEIGNDSSEQCLILQLISYADFDTAKVSQIVSRLSYRSEEFKCLSCLNEVARYERKHKKFYTVSSAIIPGSGSIMNGNVLRGTASFAIFGASAYMVYRMLSKNLYVNAIGWGLGLGYKFYAGNIKLTEKLVEEKELVQKNKLANNCELNYKHLLEKFPLRFKK